MGEEILPEGAHCVRRSADREDGAVGLRQQEVCGVFPGKLGRCIIKWDSVPARDECGRETLSHLVFGPFWHALGCG